MNSLEFDETKIQQIRKKIIENLIKERSSPNTILTIESNNSFEEILLNWTHFNSMEIIFNTEKQEFTTENVFHILKGRSNIIFLILCENGNVFGSFHSKIPKKQSSIVFDDDKHFLFSFKNSFLIPPTRFKQNVRNDNQLVIHREVKNNWIFGIGYGFHIRSDGKSYIGSATGDQLNRGYIDTIGLNSDIFVNNHYPCQFRFKNILFIQLNK